jgi:hypothetical protein
VIWGCFWEKRIKWFSISKQFSKEDFISRIRLNDDLRKIKVALEKKRVVKDEVHFTLISCTDGLNFMNFATFKFFLNN